MRDSLTFEETLRLDNFPTDDESTGDDAGNHTCVGKQIQRIVQKLILANYKHQPGKTGQCTDVGTVITSFSLFQLELLGESFLKLAVQGDQERNLFDHIA